MVRSTLLLLAAAIGAAPASAATLVDFISPTQGDEPLPPTAAPGGPRGRVVVGDQENTLRAGLEYASLKRSFSVLPPEAGNAGNFVAEPTLTVVPPVSNLAVPEPMTWAMMVAGFAVAGGALRRRSSRTTASLSH